MSLHIHLRQVLKHLRGVARLNDKIRAYCPVHGDTEHPHLEITVEGNRILIFCHKCKADGRAVMKTLGLPQSLLFLRDASEPRQSNKEQPKPGKSLEEMEKIYQDALEHCSSEKLLDENEKHISEADKTFLTMWGKRLGVSPEILSMYGCGRHTRNGQAVLTYPEHGSDHNIVGIVDRFARAVKGKTKMARRGHHRGLILPQQIPAQVDRVIITEGASDCWAVADKFSKEIGDNVLVVGLPAKKQGYDIVLDLLARLKPYRAEIIADRDDDGDQGASLLGRRIAARGIVARVVRLKSRYKDIREWIKAGATKVQVEKLINSVEPLEILRFRFTNLRDLENMPDLEFLVDGIIPCGAFVLLIAPPKTKKSFVALSISMSVAFGLPWEPCNAEVKEGGVIYVSAEGNPGEWKARVRACLKPYDLSFSGTKQDRLHFLFDQPILNSDDLAQLMEALDKLEEKISLIVLDTLARTFTGEENSANEIGRYVRAVDEMRMRYGHTA